MFIQKKNKEDSSYKRLQDESLEMLQRLSGNRWTDFNDHDPGVTIMDVLNYALLELEYSCGLPLEEYFIEAGSKKGSDENIGLFSPEVLFAPTVVTPDDYSSLILDTFSEVNSCVVTAKNSLYTIKIKSGPSSDKNLLRSEVASLYHRNRNLCENLSEVIIEEAIESERQTDRVNKEKDISYNPIDISQVFLLQQNLRYRSVQYDFPDCYGINEKGLSPNVSPERRAAALQLKAYLLIYDCLLSAANQQILSVRQLLQLSSDVSLKLRTDIDIKDIEILLDSDKQEKTEIFNREERSLQKEHFFNYLDGMYGEETYRYVKDIQDSTERNARRTELIRNMPKMNAIRFLSFDLLNMESKSGIEQFVSLLAESLTEEADETFYIVEHILLTDEKQNPGELNKLTIVLPDGVKEFRPQGIYPKLFKERLPAHIGVEYRWLSPEDMAWFKRAYLNWREAWATDGNVKIADYSNEIKNLLSIQ